MPFNPLYIKLIADYQAIQLNFHPALSRSLSLSPSLSLAFFTHTHTNTQPNRLTSLQFITLEIRFPSPPSTIRQTL